MRYVYLSVFFLVVLTVGALGFRGSISTKPPLEVFPDMDRQSKYLPQDRSEFFADGRTDRPLPAGVVARGDLKADTHLDLGRDASGEFARGFPVALTIDRQFIDRGRERYEIYCAPCHGNMADGRGIVTQYGWGTPANLHSDLYRSQAEGEIFNTITHGKNTMFGYGDKLVSEDRWAVIAYVRALQRSQDGRLSDVPASHQAELN
ncbi:c-type cytochrome [Synoicihabitans lomoniglobus]|uniref:Cytochrome c n=1 Tax=Synoicihabitans lomoniglobus TaxID=2909285 RepID=A0AAF0CR04_9BACT|nr:cytochrome c [Opitutaceae bacterium LMO-M01]WED66474.1 cytochrome c [Opitutaceae bacterium LMO-M01]